MTTLCHIISILVPIGNEGRGIGRCVLDLSYVFLLRACK